MTGKKPDSNGRGSGGVTLSDVARLAGVAPMTVSRCLNQPDSVRSETRLKVQRAIDQTGYVQNRLAGSLATSRSRLVAVVLPMVTNPIFSDTFEAINECLTRSGYQVLLGISGYQSEQEQELLDVILSRRPDGIILTGTLHTPASRNRLRPITMTTLAAVMRASSAPYCPARCCTASRSGSSGWPRSAV